MKKLFNITTYDDRIEIRTTHPLWNRIRMSMGLILNNSFTVLAPTEIILKNELPIPNEGEKI